MKPQYDPPLRPFEEMLDWLRRNGAVFPKVAVVRNDSHQITLVSQEVIEPDEMYIRIPHHCTMSASKARQSPIGQAILASGVPLRSEHTILAAHLLEERANPDSVWQPYLLALPREFREVPLYFPSETLVHLQGSYALDHIFQRHRTLLEDYQMLHHAVAEFRTFSLADFFWARTAINSRSFNFRSIEPANVTMVPLVDFCNHGMDGVGKWGQCDEEESIGCWARRRILPGEEIVHSYGNKSTGRLFVVYGFVSVDPRRDDARLVIVLDPDDPLYERKRILNPAIKKHHHYVGLLYDRQFQDLLGVFRLLVIKHLDELSQPGLQQSRPVSLDNELAALSEFAQCCRRSLSLFPTTVACDQATMEKLRTTAPVDVNALHAVEIRWREKRVLLECLGFANEAQKILKLPPAERLQRVDHLHPEARLKKYVRDIMAWEET